MYIINLRYTGALAEIDDALDAHRLFLERQFAADQTPRTATRN
jgi:hypothetical protein